ARPGYRGSHSGLFTRTAPRNHREACHSGRVAGDALEQDRGRAATRHVLPRLSLPCEETWAGLANQCFTEAAGRHREVSMGRREIGYSLIEALVCIAVLAVAAGLAAPGLGAL